MSELTYLPDDVATIQAEVAAALQAYLGRTLQPIDPLRRVGDVLAMIQAQALSAVNGALNQTLVASASGEYLAALGVMFGIARLPAEAATCTVRASLAAARGGVTAIPAGTRVTAGSSGLYFATVAYAEIPAGQTSVDVVAACETPGPEGNGCLPGELTTLVDAVPYVAAVTNLTASAGGAAAEDDQSLRARILLAPAAFGNGSEDSYTAMTAGARADIADICVTSPAPREVAIYVTLTDGALPSAEVLAEIADYVADPGRRAMSDLVTVQAPAPVSYTVELTYYLHRSDAARTATIAAAVDEAVDAYLRWQRAAIGRDVNPSELVAQVKAAGAWRVDVAAPSAATVGVGELAVCSGTPAITYGGLIE